MDPIPPQHLTLAYWQGRIFIWPVINAAINLLPLDPAWDPQAPINVQLVRAREVFDVATAHLNAVHFPILPGMLETIVAAATGPGPDQTHPTPPIEADIVPHHTAAALSEQAQPTPSIVANVQPHVTPLMSAYILYLFLPFTLMLSTSRVSASAPGPSASTQSKSKKKRKGGRKSMLSTSCVSASAPGPSASSQSKPKKKRKGSRKSRPRQSEVIQVWSQADYDPHYAMMQERYGPNLRDEDFDYWGSD